MIKMNLVGRIFDRLEVISEASVSPRGKHRYWVCFCVCGKAKEVRQDSLLNGAIRSCGCLQTDGIIQRLKKHGMSKTPIYKLWFAIKSRCTSESDPSWNRYGGRGIKICNRWLKFENFFEDMGYKPDGLSIERKDNDGDYTPENCMWADKLTQQRNTSRNNIVTYEGKSLCLSEWEEKLGVKANTILTRLRRGWTVKQSLFGRSHTGLN